MPPRANIAFPTRYRLGWGRRSELPGELKIAGLARALVVTDPGVEATPWFGPTVAAVSGAVAGTFSAISTNPTEDELLAGVARYRELGADGIVAIGGGAAMDLGKAIALYAHVGAGARGELAALSYGGSRARAVTGAAPIVALPTTAGTGSELSTGAVVKDGETGAKRTLLHPALMPQSVIADPETTVGLPAHVTAATGLDALTHAIEAVCAPGYHPMCDAIGLEAAAMVMARLPQAVRVPDDADARTELLHASSMAAVAFQKGLGLTHAMAHPLGAELGVHHGLANAVLLPIVLEVNGDAAGPACARLARRLGLGGADPVLAVADAVRALCREVGLPASVPLAEVVEEPDAPATIEALSARLAALALAETLFLATNPRKVAGDEIAAAYRRALTAPAA
ncbi:MAG TPA: iron-containing alcohol dehydrogenase [Kofleriaceae bacterium]|nr:iron-containing alcohol dehydrogenase [Kofleriaceae bacterium]